MAKCALINIDLDAICKHVGRNRLVGGHDTGESEVHYTSLDVVSRNVANQVQDRKESVPSRLRVLSVLCDQDGNKRNPIIPLNQTVRNL
jgi:hypothetical protein